MNLATLVKNVKKNKPYEFSVGGNFYRVAEIRAPKIKNISRPFKDVKIYTPTKAESEAIEIGRKEIKNGEYVTLEELQNDLGIKN